MEFTVEQVIPGPLDAVEDAFVDPAFLARLAQLPSFAGVELLDQQVDGDVVRQRVHYAYVGELSSAVTAIVDPAKLSWVEESVHDRTAHRADCRILPDHYANRLECSYVVRLTAQGDATRRTAQGDLRVHVPLLGGRAERAIVGGLRDHAEREAAAITAWLAERG
jgi:hypothetical protein